MEEAEKNFKAYWWSTFWGSLAFLVIGVLLLIYSSSMIEVVSYVTGGVLSTIGAINLIKVFKDKEESGLFSVELLYGMLGIIFGLVLIFKPTLLTTIIQFFLGLYIVVNSIIKIKYTWRLKKRNNERWVLSMSLSCVLMLIGVLMIFNPFQNIFEVTKTIGVMVIIYSIIDIVESVILKQNIKDILGETKKDKKTVEK